MGIFNYNNPLIRYMSKAANLMIVSFFWLLSCLPVITIIPACTALYDTMVSVINKNGDRVTGYFFGSLRDNFRKGWIFSLLSIVFGLILYTCVNFGVQLWTKNLFLTAYLAFGLVLTLLLTPVLIFIPPVLTHFTGKIPVLLRLSLYFSWKKPLRTISAVLMLAFVIFAVLYYPILALLLPGLYADLISSGMEKTIQAYLAENMPEEETPKDSGEAGEAGEESRGEEAETSLGFDRQFKE